MRLGAVVESPWGRLGALTLGWFAALLGTGMTSGHGFWSIFGARTLHGGLAQAACACAFADAVFLLVIFGKGRGHASRIAAGLFASIGITVTLATYSWIREMWTSGIG
jgi:hypothetical protein